MKHKTKLAMVVVILGCMAAACSPQRATSLDDLLGAEDLEQFNEHAMQVKEQGVEGIPVLLAVIDDSLKTKYSVFSYGKLNTSIKHLHDLATEGVYTKESVPVLVRAIEAQTAITDTLVTAETLQMITGVNAGYDAAFVSSYKVEDEERRKEMIAEWRHWYADNSGGDQ